MPIVTASAVGVSLHVVAADRLPVWVSSQMAGVEIKRPRMGLKLSFPPQSWPLKYGVAYFFAYALISRALPNAGTLARALCLAGLVLAVGGNLIRMPLMQVTVGNPVYVTLVQHAGIWVTHLAASLALAYTYDWLSRERV